MAALLNDVTQSVENLATVLAVDDENALVLQRLCEVTVDSVAGAAMASLTVHTEQAGYRTVAATDRQACAADSCQYEAHQGPTLSCMDSGKMVHASSAEARDQWPAFTKLLENTGIGSYLCAPFIVGHWFHGALTVYGLDPDGYSPVDAAVLELLATTAEVAMLSAYRYGDARDHIHELEHKQK
jgi:transcriptional regulator with GAF, ATPase, and Fis domain